MSAELSVSKQIVVAGDVTIDWNLIFFQGAQDATTLWNASNIARACPQPGGAAMLAALIETLTAGARIPLATRIYAPRPISAAISSGDRCFNHSYAIWGLLGDKEKKGWRVSQFLGIDSATAETGLASGRRSRQAPISSCWTMPTWDFARAPPAGPKPSRIQQTSPGSC